jgi:hypothetical protein
MPETARIADGPVPHIDVVWGLLREGRGVDVENKLLGYNLYLEPKGGMVALEVVFVGEGIKRELCREFSLQNDFEIFKDSYLNLFNARLGCYKKKIDMMNAAANSAPVRYALSELSKRGYVLEPKIPLLGYVGITLRYEISASKYGDFIGYLDYDPFINHYSGNHYFGLRGSGKSSVKGAEKTKHFRDFDEIAKNYKDASSQVLELENYGKYGDPRAYDIWAIVKKEDMEKRGRGDIYSCFEGNTTTMCLVYNEEKVLEGERDIGIDAVLFSDRLRELRQNRGIIDSAKSAHAAITRILDDPVRFQSLRDARAVTTIDALRQLVHLLFSEEEEEKSRS